MAATRTIQSVLDDRRLIPELKKIARKVFAGERVTEEEGVQLFEKGEPGYLGALSNYLREGRHQDRTYFNRNFHIEPTNVCIYTCSFCSYSRLIKKREEGWEYSLEEIMEIVRKYDKEPVTEVHIVGGALPQYDLEFYTELFRQIKAHRPELHIKALTPVEYHYIFKKGKVSYAEGMKLMKEAGLDSMPGGGAEIFLHGGSGTDGRVRLSARPGSAGCLRAYPRRRQSDCSSACGTAAFAAFRCRGGGRTAV